MSEDVYHNVKEIKALTAQTLTADANGATIDRRGHHGPTRFDVNVGVTGDTPLSGSKKLELEIEHSDDGSSWADAANADLVDFVTGTNTGTFAVIDDDAKDDAVYVGAYKGKKRYCRLVANLTGTHTNGIPVSAVSYQNPLAKPVR